MLGVVNVRIDSLTAERKELDRLLELEQNGHFDKPVFPVLTQFESCEPAAIFEQIRRDESSFVKLTGSGGFDLKNNYYGTPDAEVVYAIVQLYRPAKIVEVGSGYSTQLFRAAIEHAGIKTRLTSIDPRPRQEISQYADVIIREPVEKLPDLAALRQLESSHILFIDSSHEVKPGSDVLHVLFDCLPTLAPGVLVHFHDIFLPYEYPREYLIDHRWNWTEQYLVQAFLTENNAFEVIWPGYYLQRTMPSFERAFKQWDHSRAQSLWLRKRE